MKKDNFGLKQLCWILPALFCTPAFAVDSAPTESGQGVEVAAPHAGETINATDPVKLMKSLTDNLLADLNQNQSKLKADSGYIYQLVDEVLVPHIDTVGMARSVLGHKNQTLWNAATDADREAFTHAFIQMVVRTYAAALSSYTNQTVKYFPIRGGVQGKQKVVVDSQIIRGEGAPPLQINYSLINLKGQWKLYNMSVEGVNLLSSFGSQIQAMINPGVSLSQLTQKIQTHNANTTSS